jgi:hypothetical protein
MQNQDAVNKVLGALRELAGVVGSTSEKLWPMAVKNTMVRGMTDLIVGVLIAVICTVGLIVVVKKSKGFKEDEERTVTQWVAIIFYLIAITVTLGIAVGSGLPSFLAPEGETLRMILGK